MKKRKLNSRNPKYLDKSQVNETNVLKTKHFGSAKVRDRSGKLTGDTIIIKGVWYE